MKKVLQLIREIIPVILGILIALLINNWNDNRKERRYLDQIYSSIKNELEESVADIKRNIPKQLAAVDTINNYLNNNAYSIYDIMIKADGIHSPSIKTNSWNALANSKIELIEYEKLSALADIEDWKKNLSKRTERQMDFLFQNMEETDKGKKEIYRMIVLDIVGSEKRLQSTIEEILKEEPYVSYR